MAEQNKQQMSASTDNEKTTNAERSFDPYAPHKIRWWGWPLLLMLIVGTVYIFRTNHPSDTTRKALGKTWQSSDVQRCEGAIFGTFYHITYEAPKNLQGGIERTLKQVDQSLSPFNEKSVITAINNNTDMHADAMFTDVFTLAKDVSAATHGAFDITVAPLVNLWGFGFKNMDKVDENKVDSLLAFVGIDKVTLEDGFVKKDNPSIMLDCSAIAKGYGVDAAGLYLEQHGVKNYMVEIGGEVRVRGTNPKGELWRIGINKPIDDPKNVNNEIQQVLQVTQLSMATSGNYRNFYEKDGKKYAHTIDPRTGHPVQHSILSSTVLTQDCATADAYATAFMVLGLDEAKIVLNQHNELMAFFIYTDEDGNLCEWYTESLRNLLENR